MTSPYAKAFTDEEVADFWETHAGDNPECDTCRWLLTLTYPSKREPARTAGDPRVAALEAMAARWEADADAIETSTTSTRNRRRLAAETLRLTASEVRGLLSEASSVREPGGEGAA